MGYVKLCNVIFSSRSSYFHVLFLFLFFLDGNDNYHDDDGNDDNDQIQPEVYVSIYQTHFFP